MDDYTPQQRLAEVNQALRAMRDDLEAQISADTPSHLFSDVVVAVFEGR